jgi:hypothetical protein
LPIQEKLYELYSLRVTSSLPPPASSSQPQGPGRPVWTQKTTRLDKEMPQPGTGRPGLSQTSQATILELWASPDLLRPPRSQPDTSWGHRDIYGGWYPPGPPFSAPDFELTNRALTGSPGAENLENCISMVHLRIPRTSAPADLPSPRTSHKRPNMTKSAGVKGDLRTR